MVLVWRIADDTPDDLPNSPNFLPSKLSRYTVHAYIGIFHVHSYIYKHTPMHASGAHNCFHAYIDTCAHILATVTQYQRAVLY